MPVAARGLVTQAIKRFKGINRFRTATQTGPEWAIDLRNVIIHRHGGVEKLRVPVAISDVLGGLSTGPSSFFDYQRADGTRQVIAMEGTRIYRFAGTPLVGLEIDNNAGNAGTWSAVQSNNLLFMMNGTRALKWDGTNLQNWGIVAPVNAPDWALENGVVIGSTIGTQSLTRAANVVTVNLNSNSYYLEVGDIIKVTGVTPASFNGTFAVASRVDGHIDSQFTYNQTGSNESASVQGSVSRRTSPQNNTVATLTRADGVVSVVQGVNNGVQLVVGETVEINGAADSDFDGIFIVDTVTDAINWTYIQTDKADASTTGGKTRTPVTLPDGRSWRYAFKNAVTGHVGPPSPTGDIASLKAGPNTSFHHYYLEGDDGSVDSQIDAIVWYDTINGGGDPFFAEELSGASKHFYRDRLPDLNLNKGIRAQFLNEPPPVGFFLAKSAGRIFILRLAAARHDIAYTGYERILDGRPEESVPPSNRLRLAIGADEIRGGGAIQAGIVAFSKSNEMFMYRGVPEDVTTDEPIAFAAILEQLPWDIGCASGHTVKSTPYGLAWYGADNKVYVYNGEGEPIDMSEGIYPLLRQVTASARANSRAAFFRWLESDWYALLVPVNGSSTLNRIFLFDMTNDESNVGILVLDINADSIGIIETADGDRRLVIGQGGLLKELAVGSYTDLGITTTPGQTAGNLAAWHRTGYFGNETPQAMKMWRFINTVLDQGGFTQDLYFVDRTSTLLAPLIITGNEVIDEQVVANRKAKRMSVLTTFPVQDVTATMLEMSVSHIPVSER